MSSDFLVCGFGLKRNSFSSYQITKSSTATYGLEFSLHHGPLFVIVIDDERFFLLIRISDYIRYLTLYFLFYFITVVVGLDFMVRFL